MRNSRSLRFAPVGMTVLLEVQIFYAQQLLEVRICRHPTKLSSRPQRRDLLFASSHSDSLALPQFKAGSILMVKML
jgi:hypothetical protein